MKKMVAVAVVIALVAFYIVQLRNDTSDKSSPTSFSNPISTPADKKLSRNTDQSSSEKELIKPKLKKKTNIDPSNEYLSSESDESDEDYSREVKSEYFQNVSDQEIEDLVNTAKQGDTTSLMVMNNLNIGCFHSGYKSQQCKIIQSNLNDFNPFEELEKAAISGDKLAQKIYMDELVFAAGSGLINPLADSEKWVQRKNMGVNWLVSFARKGNANSARKLANFYAEGYVIPQDLNRAALFSKRAAILSNDKGDFEFLNSLLDREGVDETLVQENYKLFFDN